MPERGSEFQENEYSSENPKFHEILMKLLKRYVDEELERLYPNTEAGHSAIERVSRMNVVEDFSDVGSIKHFVETECPGVKLPSDQELRNHAILLYKQKYGTEP